MFVTVAILMVLIAYGLRSGEVTGLRLDDVDWAEETLRVRRPKPGRTHHYPLSRGVGQAIVRYLTDVRPPRPERALFPHAASSDPSAGPERCIDGCQEKPSIISASPASGAALMRCATLSRSTCWTTASR